MKNSAFGMTTLKRLSDEEDAKCREPFYPLEDETIEICLDCGAVLGSDACYRAH